MVDKRHTRGVALHTFSFGLAQEWRLSMPKILSLFIQTLKNKDEQSPSKLSQSGDVSGIQMGSYSAALLMCVVVFFFPRLSWGAHVMIFPCWHGRPSRL